MTNNVIQFDRYRSTLCMPHGRDQEHRPPERKAKPAPCPKALPTSPAFDGRRKNDADSPSIEPNITEVLGKHGKKSYRVQIRKTVNGVSKSFAKTFSQLPMARKWKKRILAELELNGINVEKSGSATVADAITARLSAQKSLCRSAVQQLNWLRNSPFGAEDLSKLTVESLQNLADDMLGAERMPQTVAGYLSILVATLNWASKRSFSIPISELRTAMEIMWEDEILARSEERERRPSLEELDLILDSATNNPRQKLPLANIAVFAIFSCRRLGEICRLRWEDLRVSKKMILVRNMKHPRKKQGNDVWCSLTDEALAIILEMPRSGEFIFPFKATSVGAAWRRHRDRLDIKDLRFHDLRHEGITRLFEMEHPAAFVANYSGHKSGGCLDRYEHVERRGDKFLGWPWLDRVLGKS